jgi:broad specificity phosphatase PhoE
LAEALPGTDGRRRIYLLRHGQVQYFNADGSARDPDQVLLTADGEAQARAMAALLSGIPFDRAVHTGLARSRQTLELVLNGRELPMEEVEGLRELRVGRLRHLTPEALDAEFVYGLERAAEPGAVFANGEAYAEAEARMLGAFQSLLATPGWSRLLLVAHDGTNRMLLGWVTGGGLASLGAFEQDPGCLNIIDVDIVAGRILRKLVKALNLTPANPAKHGNYKTSFEQIFHVEPD